MDRESVLRSEMGRNWAKWIGKTIGLCHVSLSVAYRGAVERDMPLQEGESTIPCDRNNSRVWRHLCYSDEQLQGFVFSIYPQDTECSPIKQEHQIIISWWGKTWISAQALPLLIWPSWSSSSSKDARTIFCLCPLKNPTSGQSNQS